MKKLFTLLLTLLTIASYGQSKFIDSIRKQKRAIDSLKSVTKALEKEVLFNNNSKSYKIKSNGSSYITTSRSSADTVEISTSFIPPDGVAVIIEKIIINKGKCRIVFSSDRESLFKDIDEIAIGGRKYIIKAKK